MSKTQSHGEAGFGGYLRYTFNLPSVVTKARRLLRNVKFDTVVGTGISGTVAAAVIARSMRKNLAIVRKSKDDNHSGSLLEGITGKRYIFVDDFVSSGETRNRVKRTMTSYSDAEYVGTFTYQASGKYEPDRSAT